MWEYACWKLNHKESWAQKNWSFEMWCWRRLESSLDCKEIKPASPRRNQSWIFIGRTDTEAETPILWPPDMKSWLIWKDLDTGKDWGLEEKGTTEDEMAGWHHRLDGHEFEWTLAIGDGQGGLMCCGSWSCRVAHDWVTELNWKLTALRFKQLHFKWLHKYLHKIFNFSLWLTKSIMFIIWSLF